MRLSWGPVQALPRASPTPSTPHTPSGDSCRDSIFNTTLNGKQIPLSFQNYGTGQLVVKVTNLPLSGRTTPYTALPWSGVDARSLLPPPAPPPRPASEPRCHTLPFAGPSAAGAIIGFSLLTSAACPTIESFLAQYTYAIMNDISSEVGGGTAQAMLGDQGSEVGVLPESILVHHSAGLMHPPFHPFLQAVKCCPTSTLPDTF